MDYYHISCPACHTRFRISESQLNARNGQVRCGACRQVFNAKAELKKIQTTVPNQFQANSTLHTATTMGSNRLSQPLDDQHSRTRDSRQIQSQHQPQNLPRASSANKSPLTVPPPNTTGTGKPLNDLTKKDIEHQKKTEYHYRQYNDAEMPNLDTDFMKRVKELDEMEYSLSDLDNQTAPNTLSSHTKKSEASAITQEKTELNQPLKQDKSPENGIIPNQSEPEKANFQNISNIGLVHANEVHSDIRIHPSDDLNIKHLTGLNQHLAILDDKNRKWLYILIGLLSFLMLQLFFFYRTEISSSMPKLKGVYETICIPFGCEVPLPRELNKVTVEGSDMEQAIGNEHNLITLHVTLVNHAPYPVEYPAIALDILDQNQKTIARKVLYPDDYLNSMKTLKRGLGPDETQLNIRLELERLEAFGYHLELLYSSSVTYPAK